jgi:peptidoglycan/LPS O-acetylase OafA/YrhL
MGILRALLALAVVFAHTPAADSLPILMPGSDAVRVFYIISGFLISFILRTNKAYKKNTSFFINRFLRLYPIYWTVAALSLAANLTANRDFFARFGAMPLSAWLLVVASTVLLFGQDWVMFASVQQGHLRFTGAPNNSDVLLYRALLVPQAWTLGVELSFYLIAPFVVRRMKLIILLLALSLMLRVALLVNGVGLKDPWTYRFFPAELALFLLGALSHQILLPLYQTYLKASIRTASIIATSVLAVYTVLFNCIPGAVPLKEVVLLGGYIILIPLTFVFQNAFRTDKSIGELSYPLYIGHFLVIEMLTAILPKMHITGTLSVSMCSLAASILFAMFLNSAINSKVELIRARIRNRGSAALAPRRD